MHCMPVVCCWWSIYILTVVACLHVCFPTLIIVFVMIVIEFSMNKVDY